MFTLVLIDDDIPIQPNDFRDDYRLQLKRQIQAKYVDRVIPNVGLCIEFYDFVCVKDALIYPGDGKLSNGEAYYKVEFRVIVFKPVNDEWIVGSIASCDKSGINVSLGFFRDIVIPASNMRLPYAYDNQREVWVWKYRNAETRENINFFYEANELIRFRVMSTRFCDGSRSTGKESVMQVIGAVDRDGLGCVSWWPDNAPFDEPLGAPGGEAPEASSGAPEENLRSSA